MAISGALGKRPAETTNEENEITENESNRFVVKVAEFLKPNVEENGWDESLVREAFDAAVETMPKGRARRALREDFDVYAKKLCDAIFRDDPPPVEYSKTERKMRKMAKDPKSALHAMYQEPLADLSKASLDALLTEFDYSLKRASFDLPAFVYAQALNMDRLTPDDIVAAEEERERGLRRILDVAQATLEAFGKSSKKSQDCYDQICMLIGRLAGAISIRRKSQGARDVTAKMAAEVVLMRHDFRKTALVDSSLSLPEHEVGVTACHDGAALLGNFRGDFSALLIERIPEDEAKVTDEFSEDDLPLFECALGLGGFDAEYEKDAKKAGLLFGVLDIDGDVKATSKNIGPSLLIRPPKDDFDMQREENDYNMEAFAKGHTARSKQLSVAESNWNTADFVDTDYLNEALSLTGRDDDENSGPGRVKLYFSLMRIARAYIKLLNAGGKRKKSAAVARYMSAAPAPEVLLMHVPDDCGIDNTDARAMSVELAVSSAKALKLVVNEWNEMRDIFKNAAQSEGGFYLDVSRAEADATVLDNQGEAAKTAIGKEAVDEEMEAELMEMLDKLEAPEEDSDESDDESSDEE